MGEGTLAVKPKIDWRTLYFVFHPLVWLISRNEFGNDGQGTYLTFGPISIAWRVK